MRIRDLQFLCLLTLGCNLVTPVVAQPASVAPTNVARIRLETKELSFGKLPWLARPEDAVISPDSRHAAFLVSRGNRQQAVLRDGIGEKTYDEVRNISFSPDSQRLAYQACRGSKCLVVVDGREGPVFDGIGDGHPVFSPNSRRVAYAGARRNN